MTLPTEQEIQNETYPRWDGNGAFERQILRDLGLPEDYHPTEDEAYQLVTSWMED